METAVSTSPPLHSRPSCFPWSKGATIAVLLLPPAPGPCVPKLGLASQPLLKHVPKNAMWQLSCVPLGRIRGQEPCWKVLLSPFALLRVFSLLHEVVLKVHPVPGLMAASHVWAEEFSKVCQLEFYLAFFLNEKALAVPNNNCEINHSWYFFSPTLSC